MIERIGSSGRTRTYNPPVNSRNSTYSGNIRNQFSTTCTHLTTPDPTLLRTAFAHSDQQSSGFSSLGSWVRAPAASPHSVKAQQPELRGGRTRARTLGCCSPVPSSIQPGTSKQQRRDELVGESRGRRASFNSAGKPVQTSVLKRLDRDPFLQQRKSYTAICGDHCAAVLLSFFEYQANLHLLPDGSIGWTKISLSNLSIQLFALYGRTKICDELKKLEAMNFIESQSAPKGDNKGSYYRLRPQVVNRALDEYDARRRSHVCPKRTLTPSNPSQGDLSLKAPTVPGDQTEWVPRLEVDEPPFKNGCPPVQKRTGSADSPVQTQTPPPFVFERFFR